MSQPRSSGKPEIASPPDVTSCHRSSGEPTPPGRRQLIATIAIGSSSAAAVRCSGCVAPCEPSSWARRNRARAVAFG